MSALHLTNADDVAAGLRAPELVPPPGPASLGDGATSVLRAGMARFRSGREHDGPRRHVESALASIDPARATANAVELTAPILAWSSFDFVADVGFVVPTLCLSLMVGLPEPDLEAVRHDVAEIVSVIGRQQPATAGSDAAAGRMIERFANHPDGPVAMISLLYQNHDASAALFAATVLAEAQGAERRSALARTVRTARSSTSIGDMVIANGATVVLSLEDPVNEFGAGAHECPGQLLAKAIVDGMMTAVVASGRTVDSERIERAPDGRAAALPVSAL